MAWLRRGSLVRPSAAVAAIAMVAAIAAAIAWGVRRGEDATVRLLTRAIVYHESQYKINRDLWQSDLDGASDLMGRTRSQFDRLTRLSDDASGLPEQPMPGRVNDGEQLRFEPRGLVEVIGRVGDRIRAASLHEDMTSYHLHMKFYYERLRKGRVAWLPPLPAALEFERMRIELGLQRRYGGSQWDDREESTLLRLYESEPPPHLARRVPKP
ncbi:hypothetical protein SAMN05444166_7880 [Singulisphaera sp. GP187]|uniref:hypothetical protein n=1 Tax=Singulisphaera sp. GP187 TaxID=1882752 RepID=UPI00092AB56A|nr:hypothetical protein [Singulisphaera sp. GP187]SIO65902.1 hypothetical protein SAMN05444166_7880 [Singulisphaera sp. GP187]